MSLKHFLLNAILIFIFLFTQIVFYYIRTYISEIKFENTQVFFSIYISFNFNIILIFVIISTSKINHRHERRAHNEFDPSDEQANVLKTNDAVNPIKLRMSWDSGKPVVKNPYH